MEQEHSQQHDDRHLNQANHNIRNDFSNHQFCHLGFLTDFLSRTVLVGFLTGVGIQVALGQFTGMLGAAGGGHGPFHQMLHDWRQLEQINPYVLGLSAAVLTIIIGARLVSKKIPGALIAVVVAITASWALDLQSQGVHLLGMIQVVCRIAHGAGA